MKKIAFMLVLLAVCAAALVGCSDTIVQGSAWADVEILTYGAYAVADQQSETELFTLTTKMENLKQGTYSLSTSPDKTYGLGLSARRYTVEAKTADGTVVMYSESLMDAFTSIASYKKVNYGSKNYTVESTFSDKTVSYVLNDDRGSQTGSVKVGKTYVSNELLYPYLRTFSSIESNMNSSITVFDVENAAKLSLNVQTLSSGSVTLKKYVAEPEKAVSAARVQILRSETPIGKYIYVDYSTTGDAAFTFESATTNSLSKRIPLQIIENDIVYYLKSVSV